MLECDLQELMEVVASVLGQAVGPEEPLMEAGLDSIGTPIKTYEIWNHPQSTTKAHAT